MSSRKARATPEPKALELSAADLVEFNKAAHRVETARLALQIAELKAEVKILVADQLVSEARTQATELRAKMQHSINEAHNGVVAAKALGRDLADVLSARYAVDLTTHGIDTDTGQIVKQPGD